MSLPAVNNQAGRPRPRRQRKQAKPKPAPLPVQELGPCLIVRSLGDLDKCKSMTLKMSEPSPGEECSIGMEPIADYKLSFMPPDEKGFVMQSLPQLTKASLPCGHGFNAIALLYHFAKNSMTCPYCRSGHPNEQMSLQSVPAHIRGYFSAHLEGTLANENRERIAADAVAAARLLEQEVRNIASLPLTRVVLLLHVFENLENSTDPCLTLELPLTSSLTLGTLAFASSGFSLAQLNLNLLRFPVRPQAFELSVGIQDMYHGSILLFKTVRFPANGTNRRVVFARDIATSIGQPMAVEVVTTPNLNVLSPLDINLFQSIIWHVSVHTFSAILLGLGETRTHQAMF